MQNIIEMKKCQNENQAEESETEMDNQKKKRILEDQVRKPNI